MAVANPACLWYSLLLYIVLFVTLSAAHRGPNEHAGVTGTPISDPDRDIAGTHVHLSSTNKYADNDVSGADWNRRLEANSSCTCTAIDLANNAPLLEQIRTMVLDNIQDIAKPAAWIYSMVVSSGATALALFTSLRSLWVAHREKSRRLAAAIRKEGVVHFVLTALGLSAFEIPDALLPKYAHFANILLRDYKLIIQDNYRPCAWLMPLIVASMQENEFIVNELHPSHCCSPVARVLGHLLGEPEPAYTVHINKLERAGEIIALRETLHAKALRIQQHWWCSNGRRRVPQTSQQPEIYSEVPFKSPVSSHPRVSDAEEEGEMPEVLESTSTGPKRQSGTRISGVKVIT
jgi:hypothetical protein